MNNQREPNKIPSIVKQLLQSVLPNNKPTSVPIEAKSPFEELYFSFPALEDDTSSISSNNTLATHCGHQHHKTNNMKALC